MLTMLKVMCNAEVTCKYFYTAEKCGKGK